MRYQGLIVAALVTVSAHADPVMLVTPKGMGAHFVNVCLTHEVPLGVAWRLIHWESKWDEQAWNRNEDGTLDLGLMQLNNAYYDDFAMRYNAGKPIDPWMWRTSINVGIKHLSTLYSVLGDWPSAVAAYNLGLTRYRKGRIPARTKEMVAYVTGVKL